MKAEEYVLVSAMAAIRHAEKIIEDVPVMQDAMFNHHLHKAKTNIAGMRDVLQDSLTEMEVL